MKTIKLFSFASLATMLIVGMSSCSKNDSTDQPDINFSVAVNGYTAQFTNTTEGGASYRWDFGDGSTSDEESPSHTYPGKGKYVPTLSVTTKNGNTLEGSTVIRISKSSSVKLDDNVLTDWDTVTHNVATSDPAVGSFRKIKLDYDAENIYFYIEMESTKAAGDIFDFYMDTDNDPATGLITWVSTGGGNDVLLEGAMLNDWFDVFYHKGEQTAFSFDPQAIAEFYSIGTVQQDGTTLKFEGKLVRAKIKNLTGKGVKLAMTATKNDWSATLGIAPNPGSSAIFLDMTE